MVELQKYINSIQNRLANERHSLDPTKPRLALDLMPTGSERDPFKFYDPSLPAGPTSHFDYLTMIASDTTKPADLSKDEFFAKCQVVNKYVFEIVKKYNGSISAEHGVGMTKKPYLDYTRSDTEIGYMKALKQVFDPNNVMNPGKLFDL